MPSVHEWVYTAASLLQKNHSQKHSDVGCRKVSVKMEKFIWRSILEAFPLQSIQKPFHSVLNIFSTNAANPVLSVVGPISTRERHEQSVKHGWDSSTWYSTERSVSQRMPVEAILSRRMCWLCWIYVDFINIDSSMRMHDCIHNQIDPDLYMYIWNIDTYYMKYRYIYIYMRVCEEIYECSVDINIQSNTIIF